MHLPDFCFLFSQLGCTLELCIAPAMELKQQLRPRGNRRVLLWGRDTPSSHVLTPWGWGFAPFGLVRLPLTPSAEHPARADAGERPLCSADPPDKPGRKKQPQSRVPSFAKPACATLCHTLQHLSGRGRW